jgi:hypothetical protein
MSIFNSIRKSRQQAKEHKSKIAEQQKKEEQQEPYRHVPTHAAADAFASAPPSWRENTDKTRIIEQNRRRSAMAANGHHMNMPSIPRLGSSLSYVSYPGSQVPRGRMSRAYSAMGISPYPDGSRDIIYSIPDVSFSEPASLKNYSPVESNSGSTTSQDDLEMPRSNRHNPPLVRPGPVAAKAHRLHPSNRSRRTSDTSVDRGISGASPGPSTSPPEQRLQHPPRTSSMYGSSAIHGTVQVGTAPTPLDADAIAPAKPGRLNRAKMPRAVDSEDVLTSSHSGRVIGSTKQGESDVPPPEVKAEKQAPRIARFTETDPGDSPDDSVAAHAPLTAKASSPLPIVNTFPEPTSDLREPSPPPKAKSKKLVKGGGKLLKRNRG